MNLRQPQKYNCLTANAMLLRPLCGVRKKNINAGFPTTKAGITSENEKWKSMPPHTSPHSCEYSEYWEIKQRRQSRPILSAMMSTTVALFVESGMGLCGKAAIAPCIARLAAHYCDKASIRRSMPRALNASSCSTS
jgi:hypothetical protein